MAHIHKMLEDKADCVVFSITCQSKPPTREDKLQNGKHQSLAQIDLNLLIHNIISIYNLVEAILSRENEQKT